MDKVVKKLQDYEQTPVDAALVKQFAAVDPPALLHNVNLHDYQLHGMRWLLTKYAQQLNPILGDEMGLGKTLVTAHVHLVNCLIFVLFFQILTL